MTVLFCSLILMVKEFYEVLGVPESASQDDIRKQYRKLAVLHHPDKHQESSKKEEAEEKFKKLGEAYETLSDPEKRRHYDMGMPDGGGFNFNMSPEDIFQQMFQGMGVNINGFNFGFAGNSPLIHQLHVTLEDIYVGAVKKFTVPVIFNGSQQIKEFSVKMEPFYGDNTQVVLQREGHSFHPNTPRGDLILIIRIQNHPKFQREGQDLHYLKEISLKESLLGFNFELETVDHRKLNITVEVITGHDTQHVIENEGLRHQNGRGNLILHFDIAYPTSLTDAQKKALSDIL